MQPIEYAELLPRLLRPDRPALAEARATISGIRSAKKAWAKLIDDGLIPPSWREDERRRFAAYEDVHGSRGEELLVPSKAADCVLFASDVQGIERAESAARELSARLKLWRGGLDERLVWTVSTLARHVAERNLGPPPGAFGVVLGALARAAELAGAKDEMLAAVSLPPQDPSLAFAQAVRTVDWLAQQWEFAAAAGWRIPDQWSDAGGTPTPLRREVAGRRFQDLPNPMQPLFGLWETGYSVLLMDAVSPDAPILLAPSVTG